MADEVMVLDAKMRHELGRGANRRLRRGDLVPAVVYGGESGSVSITLEGKQIRKCSEAEGFYSQIMMLQIDGEQQQVLLKDLQRHPAKENVTHLDFLRVLATQEVTVHIPLHFINEEVSKGVKEQGGSINHMRVEVEVICLPAVLPKYIEVDMLEVGLGGVVRLSDLKIPPGVVFSALVHGERDDQVVASVHSTRATIEDDTESESVEEVNKDKDKGKDSKDKDKDKDKDKGSK